MQTQLFLLAVISYW